MKPIQTFYQGYHFRSRLEARWAVVFDHLQMEWQYEVEGFELESGRYLPDFYLPGTEAWVEVKGGQPSDFDLKRYLEFTCAVNARGERARMLIGSIPDPRQAINAWANRVGETAPERAEGIRRTASGMGMGGGMGMIDAWTFTPDFLPLVWTGEALGHFDQRGTWQGQIKDYARVPLEDWSLKHMPWVPGGDVAGALAAGRAARFEHGQSGAPKENNA